MNTKDGEYYFLKGGGEMGELIREKDWRDTPLGSPETWPPSFRTMVAMMLDNPFGMYIAWGEEYTQVYNDAYRPILGSVKHPDALGISTKETFSEIWHIIGPMFSGVMNGVAVGSNDFMLPLNRNGYTEDCYFDFSYSPIRKENGEVGGVLVTVIETTEKKKAQDALKESNKKYFNNIMQAPVAMCVFRGKDHVVELANRLILELWGKKADEVINKPIFEALPEARGQGLEKLIDEVYATGTRFEANERPVSLPRDGRTETFYLNFVYDALRENDGTISGIVATATDATSQVMTRAKVEESEKKFRDIILQSPVPKAILRGKDHVVDMANNVLLNQLWKKTAEEVTGKKITDIFPELKEQHHAALLNEVFATGITRSGSETPLVLNGNEGEKTYYVDFDYAPLYGNTGSISGIKVTLIDRSEKVEALKKIEDNEEKLNIVIEASELGTWELNLVTREPKYSRRYLEILGGYKEEMDLSHEQILRHLHPDDFPIREKAFKEAFETGNLQYESRLIWNDGSLHWMEGHGKVLFDETGKPRKMMGTVRDITESKNYQHQLEEREQRLNMVVEASQLGISEFNPETQELRHNRRFAEMLGYSPEAQLSAAELLNHLHPDDIPLRETAMKKGEATDNIHYIARMIRDDGSVHWYENLGKISRNEENKPVKIIWAIKDITGLKEHEQEILGREQKFRLLADSMPQLVWTSDTEGNLNYFNRSIFDYAGLTPEQTKGLNWIQIVHPQDREANMAAWMKAVASGDEFVFEHRFHRYDGQYRWHQSRATPQKDEEGKIRMWVGTSTDIHDQKAFVDELGRQVEERTRELARNNIELEKMNKELQSFAYISSHDLQEPLRKIQTFSSLILEKEFHNLSDTGKDRFLRMQKAAQRMQMLIEDLLAYSRTNSTERKFKNTDLNLILDEIREDLKEELEKKKITIEAKGLQSVNIIPFQFRQLLYNLISNSVKFSDENKSPVIKINSKTVKGKTYPSLNLAEDLVYWHISIADNGIGFEQQYNEKIFEVFQRLHGKEKYVGTGIGLAIVKKIVENHNGVITAKGEPGKGATFDIFLPVD